MSYELT